MAWAKNGSPIYYLHGDTNIIVDEKGSQFIALRNVQWCSEGDEKDESKAHYELRKWRVDADGKEVASKGVTFFSKEGVDNTVSELISNGFGNTKDILLKLKERKDFKNSVETMYDTDEGVVGEYFDARELLLSE